MKIDKNISYNVKKNLNFKNSWVFFLLSLSEGNFYLEDYS